MKFKLFFAVILITTTNLVWAQFPDIKTDLDKKVKAFLEENARSWSDLNVPLSDGKLTYTRYS